MTDNTRELLAELVEWLGEMPWGGRDKLTDLRARLSAKPEITNCDLNPQSTYLPIPHRYFVEKANWLEAQKAPSAAKPEPWKQEIFRKSVTRKDGGD